MINVLIVEDDPMVAEINRLHVDRISGFTLVGIANSGPTAMEMLNTLKVDLILLDLFLPGANGLKILKNLRKQDKNVDIIIVSASKDSKDVETAFRLGVVDYLIKPFSYERLAMALEAYKGWHASIGKTNVRQIDIDNKIIRKVAESKHGVPKGLEKATLRSIWTIAVNYNRTFDIREIAEAVGLSRVSAKKYLDFLVEEKLLELSALYGSVGRPTYIYNCVNKNTEIINRYG
ncbi:MAG: response regulator receiver containing protein [Firmicutes bacterium]|nr:response regulator receiver containing protein [Bacillota bacterium]